MLRPYHIILDPVSQGGVDDFGLPPGVRDEYLQGARDQLGAIAELAERLIAAGDDTAAIEQLRRDAHRLRGSAGSFGFPQASVVAARIEPRTAPQSEPAVEDNEDDESPEQQPLHDRHDDEEMAGAHRPTQRRIFSSATRRLIGLTM